MVNGVKVLNKLFNNPEEANKVYQTQKELHSGV